MTYTIEMTRVLDGWTRTWSEVEDNDAFDIDASTGQLSVRMAVLDFESNPTYELMDEVMQFCKYKCSISKA